MVADSQAWKYVEAVPAILFSVKGQAAVCACAAPGIALHGWLTAAEGTVASVGAGHLILDDGVTLAYTLPEAFDLSPLVGARVRLALRSEKAVGGPRAQTLVLSEAPAAGSDARSLTRLVARFGPAEPVHIVGRWRVRAALSQRPNGPMAFGTARLQYVVHVGETARVRDGDDKVVVSFVARTAFDYVAYVIAERRLWIRRK